MNWRKPYIDFTWTNTISNLEQKKTIAKKISQKLKNNDVIGIGSGSTSYLALTEIANKMKENNFTITAIPTSFEIEFLCHKFGIPTTSLSSQKPNWCFDGADEADQNANLIKGRGGALFLEKLVMKASDEIYILIDETKVVSKLGTNFSVPIEIFPHSLHLVEDELIKLGANDIKIRMAISKDGPVITQNGNLLLDVSFIEIYPSLEKDIKCITGVIESGLFMNYNPIIILN